MDRLKTLGLTLSVLMIAAAARAETTLETPPLTQPKPLPPAVSDLDAAALRTAAMPTAVARRFSASGLVGSFGFLCGLQPRLVDSGSQSAFGYDPHGRFVGAKLSLAFR